MDRDKGGDQATRYFLKNFSNSFNSIFSLTVPHMDVKSCVLHIKDNIDKKFGKDAAQAFFNAANDVTIDGFYQKLGAIAQRSTISKICHFFFNEFIFLNRFNEAFTYISAIDPCTYARAFADSSSGRSSSQLIESLWAAIVFERAHPLTSLYLGVIQKLGQWVEKHRLD